MTFPFLDVSGDPALTRNYLTGEVIYEYPTYRIQIYATPGDNLVYDGSGGDRATIEQALRVLCQRTFVAHDVPQTYSLVVRRLRIDPPRVIGGF